METKKNVYEAPILTVIDVESEFAILDTSGPDGNAEDGNW